MKYRIITISAFITLALYWWALTAINAPVCDSLNPIETPEEREKIEQRINYHGLNGVVILYLGRDGQYRFERDGQWCKL